LRAAIHIGYAPNISMSKVNYLLWESIENNQYVTAFYGALDATNRTLAYANAGHNPPLLMDAEGHARFIERGGLPLGMFRDTRYYEYYLPILPGQIILLYTDGITEATDEHGAEYGRERLELKVREGRDLSARKLIDFLHADVLAWTQGRGASDDVTFVVIKAL
jgi:sigma-B regulation protein RsbU (phosphoserine phosphatase)